MAKKGKAQELEIVRAASCATEGEVDALEGRSDLFVFSCPNCHEVWYLREKEADQ